MAHSKPDYNQCYTCIVTNKEYPYVTGPYKKKKFCRPEGGYNAVF